MQEDDYNRCTQNNTLKLAQWVLNRSMSLVVSNNNHLFLLSKFYLDKQHPTKVTPLPTKPNTTTHYPTGKNASSSAGTIKMTQEAGSDLCNFH